MLQELLKGQNMVHCEGVGVAVILKYCTSCIEKFMIDSDKLDPEV